MATRTDSFRPTPESVVHEERPLKPWEFAPGELHAKFQAILDGQTPYGTLYLHATRGYWWSPLTGWPHAPTGFLANPDNVLEIEGLNPQQLRDFLAQIGGGLDRPGEWAELQDLLVVDAPVPNGEVVDPPVPNSEGD